MKYSLWKFFGLQRSGNHAVLNWLLGLDQPNTLLFHQVRAGEDLLDNPAGVSVPDGTLAYANREKGKKKVHPENIDYFSRLEKGNLLLTYEGYRIGELNDSFLNKPALDRFGSPETSINITVIRNPFNMLPSYYKLRVRTMEAKGKDMNWVMHLMDRQLEIWKSYAFLHLHSSFTRGEIISISFDQWVSDRNYRDSLAKRLGYVNFDKYIDFFSDAGGGSSFSTKSSDRKSVLSRWSEADKDLGDLFSKHKEVVDYAALIFGESSVPDAFK